MMYTARKLMLESVSFAGGAMNHDDTELTLGLPGSDTRAKSGTKRGFSETVDLSLGVSSSSSQSSRATENSDRDAATSHKRPETASPGAAAASSKPPVPKTQVVGWPPVRSVRKTVKVAVDGAPYLRKVDLKAYESYEQLLAALEDMFSCFTIRKHSDERKLMDTTKGGEYVPTYEDKDGDWMLVGDVPWKMFVESCRRLRLMKSSEALGLAPRVSSASACTSSSS